MPKNDNRRNTTETTEALKNLQDKIDNLKIRAKSRDAKQNPAENAISSRTAVPKKTRAAASPPPVPITGTKKPKVTKTTNIVPGIKMPGLNISMSLRLPKTN